MQSAARSGLVRDGALYIGASIAQRLVPLASLPVLARALSKEDLALTAVSLAVANLGAAVLPLGLNVAITRLVYDDPPGATRTRWAGLFYSQIAIGAFVTLLGVLTAARWRPWLGIGTHGGEALQLALVYAWMLSITATGQGILRAMLRAKTFAIVAVAQVAVGCAAAIYGAVVWGASGYLAGLALSGALSSALCIWHTRRKPAWDRSQLRASLRLSAPFVLHLAALWSLNLVDRLLIQRYLGSTATATYYIAYTVGSAPLLLFDAIQSAWSPRYFSGDAEQQSRLLAAMTRWAVPVGAFAAGLVALLSPLVVDLLAPSVSTRQAAQIAALVGVVALIRPRYLLLMVLSLHSRRTGAIGLASVAGAAANIVLNVALLSRFGIRWAAATTIIGYVMQAGALEAFCRASPGRLRRDSALILVGASAVVALTAGMRWHWAEPTYALTGGLWVAVCFVAFRLRHGSPRALLAPASASSDPAQPS